LSGRGILILVGTFGGFDELPEFRIFLQGFVLAELEAGAEKEILERVPAQDAVDEHAELVALKINAVIAEAETVEDVAVAFELAEIFQFAGDDVLRQAAKIAEDLELKFLGHPREFRRAGGREDDLKCVHQNGSASLTRSPQILQLRLRRQQTELQNFAELNFVHPVHPV
jgi:hypothetical protein